MLGPRVSRVFLTFSLIAATLSVAAHDVVSNSDQAVAANTPTTLGRQFSFVFPPNAGSEILRVHISSARDGSATWSVGGGATTTVSLVANVATTVTLPSDANLSPVPASTISSKMIRVTTTVDASVYADSNATSTSDASGIIPDSNLGTRYRVIAPKQDGSVSRISVLALENNTSVTITPQLSFGGFSAGSPNTVSLNAGQTYLMPTNANGQDISGSTVESTKAVAVFSSNDCTNGSASFPYVSRQQITACDFMFEQVPPVQSWGRSFIFNAFADRKQGGTPVRVVADQANTVVSVNGSAVATLNAGGVYEYNYWEAATATSVSKNEGIYLTATKPVLVATYMRGGGNYVGQTGDPAIAFIPPFEQFLTNYTVVSAPGNAAQLMNVWIPTAAISSLRFDGNALTNANFESGSVNWFAVPGTNYSTTQLVSTLGSHNLTASLAFGLMVYGANSANSYAYVGGMSLSPIGLVDSVTLTTGSTYTGNVGQETCIEVSVLDANGTALPGVRVDGTITGANAGTPLVGTSAANGVAQLCYAGASTGSDSVTLTSNQLSTSTSVTWTQIAPNISYTPSSVSVVKNGAMNSLVPSNSGSPAATWQINPGLPTGLTLDASGVISGTPTSASVSTTYTVTATNAAGSSQATVMIEVTNAAVSAAISYSPSSYSLVVGQAVTAIAPTVTGTFPTWSVSPPLPLGLTLNTQNGTITGTPTEEIASATYTVTATNSAGSTTAGITIAVGLVAPDISYAQTTVSYVKDSAISQLLPTNIGSVASSWSVSPALPTGLSFNTFTGQISGTPTAATSAANYTITATNSAGSDTFVINITVALALAQPDITYSSASVTFTQLVTITPMIPTNTGGPSTDWTISPSLPTGLSFTASTGRISGKPTGTVAAANYTVTATNASGSDTFVISITVAAPTLAPAITYPLVTLSLEQGSAMATLTPTNSGGAIDAWSVSPSLPAGLSLNTSSGVITGTPSAVVGTANYTVTATNGGGSDTEVLSITVAASTTTTTTTTTTTSTTTSTTTTTTPQNNQQAAGATTTTSTTPVNPATLPGKKAIFKPGSALNLLSDRQLDTEILVTQTPKVCIAANGAVIMLRNGICTVHVYGVQSGNLIRIWSRTVSSFIGGMLLELRNTLTTRFGYRSSVLRGKFSPTLINAMNSGAQQVIVAGHTAILTGKNPWNTKLSLARANAVKTALIRAGVKIPITAIGLGATAPLTRELTETAQQQNRRAEVYVVSNSGGTTAAATLIGTINY